MKEEEEKRFTVVVTVLFVVQIVSCDELNPGSEVTVNIRNQLTTYFTEERESRYSESKSFCDVMCSNLIVIFQEGSCERSGSGNRRKRATDLDFNANFEIKFNNVS